MPCLTNYLLSLSNKYNLNIVNFNNKPSEILMLCFDNILNCISTVAYDYYFLNCKVLLNKKFNLFNLLIGKDIVDYCSKMNFDISLTPQYLKGNNVINDKILKKSIESIFESRNNIRIRYKSSIPNNENIATKKIINFIKESVK